MRLIITIAFSFLLTSLCAQVTISSGGNSESRLAQQYFNSGEYEKAASLYNKLYQKNNANDYYFTRYIESLINLENFAECESIIKKQIKKKPKSVQLYVTYGDVLERQYKEEEAKAKYEQAIKKLPADRYITTKLANAFIGLKKYELATKAYEKGAELLKDENIFAYNLGDLYRRKGDKPAMISNYLNSLLDNPSRMN